MTTPQPGWYDDPEDANTRRYWDGQQWTSHRERKPSSQPPAAATPSPPPEQPPVAQTSTHPPEQPPAAPRVKSGVSKVSFWLVGFALVLAISALVAGRVELGSFLPGILLVAAIAIIGVIVTFRSEKSGRRKALNVTAMVLVVAVAIPASLKVVYPVYHRLFEKGAAQASPAGTAGPGTGASGTGTPGTAAPGTVTSGILVESGNSGDEASFGYIDPATGKYTKVSTFKVGETAFDPDVPELSPDLNRYAVRKSDNAAASSTARVGWIDTSGKFTAVSPATPAPTDFPRSAPPTYDGPVFDGAGNFYYWSHQDGTNHLYKVPAGSTSNPQEVTPTPKFQQYPIRNPDGTLQFGCAPIRGMWLGSGNRVTVTVNIGLSTSPTTPSSQGFVIAKFPVTQATDGCPLVDSGNQNAVKVFDLGIQNANQPVPNHDFSKLAFYVGNAPGGIYIVDVDGNGQPAHIASDSQLKNLPNLKLIRWTE
jgi:Protein of unknown function (DUF2510)